MQTGKPTNSFDGNDAVASALRTISRNIVGLDALAIDLESRLASSFEVAVELLSSITGRVIVTGVGKSAHVGSKIAATLASTGTPAFFVHPGEAHDGNLGMITASDAILALSWSGATSELKGILRHARQLAIPLVGITVGNQSPLAREAQVVISLPMVKEACPSRLAPTTSTLMQLVVGDALAVALLEARGFTPENFRVFHPGGRLGASLLKISEIMHAGEKMPLVQTGTDMGQAILEMSRKGFGCVGVVSDDGQIRGIVTDGDLRRHMDGDLLAMTVENVMTPNPKCVEPGLLAAAVLQIINEAAITTVFIAEAGRPVGIVHLHDLLRIGVA